jgi:peptidoglycan/LPS O-acetylase OafA/YrhL
VVLYCALHRRNAVRPGLYQTLASSVSRMSYTLYLVHVPALTCLCAWLLRSGDKWRLSPVNGLRFTGILSVVFAYACVMYFCFEANTAKVRNFIQSGFASRFLHRAEAESITAEVR